MNIALIGAPGTGKTSLAYRLRRALEDPNAECNCKPIRDIAIVDDYVREIETETNLALGEFADYLGNLYVAFGRYARERVARKDHTAVISCGTLIETAVYAATQISAQMLDQSEAEQADQAPRVDTTMRMLAVLYTDAFQYDYLFYLPPQPTSSEPTVSQLFDQQLQAALEGFKLASVVPLMDPASQLEEALVELGRA